MDRCILGCAFSMNLPFCIEDKRKHKDHILVRKFCARSPYESLLRERCDMQFDHQRAAHIIVTALT